MNFLLQDGNHDRLPPGKVRFDSTEYGRWLTGLLDLYLADPSPVPIRIVDDIIKLCLGGVGRKEGQGNAQYGILIVETDGEIRKNDTLRASFAGADRFDGRWNITTDSSCGGSLVAGVPHLCRNAGADLQTLSGLQLALHLWRRYAPVSLEHGSQLRQSFDLLPRSRALHPTCPLPTERTGARRLPCRTAVSGRCFLSSIQSSTTHCPSNTSRGVGLPTGCRTGIARLVRSEGTLEADDDRFLRAVRIQPA